MLPCYFIYSTSYFTCKVIALHIDLIK
jgi:hypothetical protein